MLNRRDFLKGLGGTLLSAMLARYHGGSLLPKEQKGQLIALGREEGIIKPQWQGVDVFGAGPLSDLREFFGQCSKIEMWDKSEERWISIDKSTGKDSSVYVARGGYLVPEEYSKVLWDIAKEAKVFRGIAITIPLLSPISDRKLFSSVQDISIWSSGKDID